MHTNVGGRKADLPREVGSQPDGKVNATTKMQNSTLNPKKSYSDPMGELIDEIWLREI